MLLTFMIVLTTGLLLPQTSQATSEQMTGEDSCEEIGGLWIPHSNLYGYAQGGSDDFCKLENIDIEPREMLTINEDFVLAFDGSGVNRGTIKTGGQIYVHGTLDNYGMISAVAVVIDGSLDNFPDGVIDTRFINVFSSSELDNKGSFRIENPAYQSIPAEREKVFLGSTIEGVIVNNGEIMIHDYFFVPKSGSISNTGTIVNDVFSLMDVYGNITNDGSLENNGELIIGFTNMEFGEIGWLKNEGALINNYKLIIEQGATFENNNMVNNSGNMTFLGKVSNQGSINNECGGAFQGEITTGSPARDSCDPSIPITEETTPTSGTTDKITDAGGATTSTGSDGQVTTSSEGPGSSGTDVQSAPQSGCLIATAAYGSEFAPQVQMLRDIRDNQLLKTASGSAFMSAFNSFYYSWSPTVAEWERQNPVFKEAVRITITPLITTLSILTHVSMDTEEEALGYGIGVILLNVGIYFVAPVLIISKVWMKRK